MRAGISKGNIRDRYTEFEGTALSTLRAGVLCLAAGEKYPLESGEREVGILLIRGECILETQSGTMPFGPRENPFMQRPWAFLLGRGRHAVITALQDSTLGIGSAKTSAAHPDQLIPPEDTGGGPRGEGCFAREVRFAIWSDNSKGDQLMMGETIIPPGHWSSYPPHKHDEHIPGKEARYEEAYYFEFEAPEGFALVRQYDRNNCDQAVCVRSGDLAYMAEGYHPVVNSPAGRAYQLTLMAGTERQSVASIDCDFLRDNSQNPYQNQRVRR